MTDFIQPKIGRATQQFCVTLFYFFIVLEVVHYKRKKKMQWASIKLDNYRIPYRYAVLWER